MFASFLMGLVGGQRALTPLAAVSVAAARGELPEDTGAPPFLDHPVVAAGALLLAIGEMAGDKQKTSPDRVILPGLAARFLTSAIAGATLAPRKDRWLGAAIGGVTAVAASWPGWRARMEAMESHGQTPTGFVEDLAVIGAATAIVRSRG